MNRTPVTRLAPGSLDLQGRLRPLALAAGYPSLSALGRAMGVDPSSPLDWASGRRSCARRHVPRLAAALGLSVQTLTVPVDPRPAPLPRQVPIAVFMEPALPRDVLPEAELLGRCADPLCADPLCQRWLLPCGCYALVHAGESPACRHATAAYRQSPEAAMQQVVSDESPERLTNDCDWCGALIVVQQHWQRFCSRACRMAHARRHAARQQAAADLQAYFDTRRFEQRPEPQEQAA